jgi:hypothetical protein
MYRQQFGELVAGPCCISHATFATCPAGEASADVQGEGVFGAEDMLDHGQQGGELVISGDRVLRFTSRPSEARTDGEGVRVLGSQGPLKLGQ